ncbi:MAG: argininosuccinate lyase [Candidatus Diapherotrites archaeon]|nr:argininosuccinate lyase [Candidatus Diapherotrites archaeon]
MKLWEKKNTKTDAQIEKFTVGNDFLVDLNMVEFDCIASSAHAKMLEKNGIFSRSENKKIQKELLEIRKLAQNGKFRIKTEEEDCHTAIENHLTKKLGKTGKKIHTYRSRNDQVMTAMRLYSKHEISKVEQETGKLISALERFAEKNKKVKMPGYTHMQKAMPSSVPLWANAFADSLKDDLLFLKSVKKLTDQNPLGSAAGYGLPHSIDRKITTKLLGFKKVQKNPLYCANSRGKFESMIMSALMQLMLDLNKMSSDILLFSTKEFGFFDLPDEFCSGSSLMPQKRNPDAVEIIRAKSHSVKSRLFEIISIISSLPSGYNRDFQLSKEPFICAIQSTKDCLQIMTRVISNLEVNSENCKKAMIPELFAAQKVLEKTQNGKPFREAYREIADEMQGA